MLIGAHVEIGPCLLDPECDWTGMHWHWDARRFRSIGELSSEERVDFDALLIIRATEDRERAFAFVYNISV